MTVKYVSGQKSIQIKIKLPYSASFEFTNHTAGKANGRTSVRVELNSSYRLVKFDQGYRNLVRVSGQFELPFSSKLN